ncbi:MAG: tRNA glutamyl-Q(34) synthetase GluQRS [Rhodobacteraceae bacterium]|nr:tRNA glutamyl-Q(34) synthetase GluQRS [Paracoccaceae bacterium]
MAGLITRFAPSPTGPLHLGHAFSALTAAHLAETAQGQMLLRIEDIDTARCKPLFEQQIYDDLHWLGLDWPVPVMRQSDRRPAYRAALSRLAALGVTYRCTCTRGDIRAALSAPQEGAPRIGPDGPVYPGTCREAGHQDPGAAIRLNMDRAVALVSPVRFRETGPLRPGWHPYSPEWLVRNVGDIVLARRDLGTSYHLAVTVDDAAQGITLVTRGADLFDATPIHVLLQRLLDLPTPAYHHHRLIRDAQGKRLAKRDDARALGLFRAEGATPADIRAMIGL